MGGYGVLAQDPAMIPAVAAASAVYFGKRYVQRNAPSFYRNMVMHGWTERVAVNSVRCWWPICAIQYRRRRHRHYDPIRSDRQRR